MPVIQGKYTHVHTDNKSVWSESSVFVANKKDDIGCIFCRVTVLLRNVCVCIFH